MRDAVSHPVLNPRDRLRCCAALRAAGAVTTGGPLPNGGEMRLEALCGAVALPDSTLSPELAALEEAGYVRRRRDDSRVPQNDVVWVSLTKKGLDAFEEHLEALREIAGVSA